MTSKTIKQELPKLHYFSSLTFLIHTHPNSEDLPAFIIIVIFIVIYYYCWWSVLLEDYRRYTTLQIYHYDFTRSFWFYTVEIWYGLNFLIRKSANSPRGTLPFIVRWQIIVLIALQKKKKRKDISDYAFKQLLSQSQAYDVYVNLRLWKVPLVWKQGNPSGNLTLATIFQQIIATWNLYENLCYSKQNNRFSVVDSTIFPLPRKG